MALGAYVQLQITLASATGDEATATGAFNLDFVYWRMNVLFHNSYYTVWLMSSLPSLILASSSVFRKHSLRRLRLDFDTVAPGVTETALPNEQPRARACRLAAAKAAAVAEQRPTAVVIGADQVLDANGKCYGKPGSSAAAISQLEELAGQSGKFLSAVCILHKQQSWSFCCTTEVAWLDLTSEQIKAYVTAEPSFESAGAAQLENYGICLLRTLRSDDPSAVLGLPLIKLCAVLREIGYPLPCYSPASAHSV